MSKLEMKLQCELPFDPAVSKKTKLRINFGDRAHQSRQTRRAALRHQPDAATRDRSIVWRKSHRTSITTGPFADIASATTSAACAAFDGSLRIRSHRTAHAYIGADAPPLADAEGFVDTGDMVELRGERYHFVGRRGGIINIGGLKVHPEEIEAVINRHESVRMSRARSRRSPITGAIVVADIVLADGADAGRQETIRTEMLGRCKDSLAAYKVPAVIRFVERLDVTAAGKLARADA